MIARIASIPLVAWLAYVVYQVFVLDRPDHQLWLVPPVILLAAVWVSYRELDQWILGERNKDLDEDSVAWLARFSPVYPTLSKEQQMTLRYRTRRIIHDSLFMSMSGEKFPDDAGLALAHDQALLTLKQPLQLVETYVLYTHPFLTPDIPDKVHTCEFEAEDKVVIVSAEQLLPGFLRPLEYLNISMYAHGLALFNESSIRQQFSSVTFPDAEVSLNMLGMDIQVVTAWVGLPELHTGALSLCAYLYAPEQLHQAEPELFGRFERLLGIHNAR